MAKKKQRRIVETLPAKLMKEIRQSRQLIAKELPDLIHRDQMAKDAMKEKTFSGLLRNTIHQSKLLLPDLATRAEVDMDSIADFLTGAKTLPSDAIDRLVKILRLKLPTSRPK